MIKMAQSPAPPACALMQKPSGRGSPVGTVQRSSAEHTPTLTTVGRPGRCADILLVPFSSPVTSTSSTPKAKASQSRFSHSSLLGITPL